MSENRTGKPALPAGRYFKYAIGEIILVVLGILIALQINNWNEERKLSIERHQLITALLEDFEYTKTSIKNDRLPVINKALEDIEIFNHLIKQDVPSVSVDSLRNLAISFFRSYPFIPTLSTLNEASSSGKLSLLKNKELYKKFTEFEIYYEAFRKLDGEKTHAYFNGSLWEIRKTVKPDVLAGSNPIPGLTYEEYKRILDQPLVATGFHTASLFVRNKKRRLDGLLGTTEDIISLLKNLQH
ncbi:DUF6090 family protein [Winogradskyella maritima]|uniref:DUF6090 family protein n=2 Tax=Winogradskyella maritima TaxID=1517766 RepID=A0ABV8AHD8_9FLAO